MNIENIEPQNHILSALPEVEYQRIFPFLETITLPIGHIIYERGELIDSVYFPNRGMISLVSIMEDGSTTEIGLIGNEGMVGLPVFLGGKHTTSRAIVQIEGSITKLPGAVLREEFNRNGKLKDLLLLYTQALLTQVSQSAACNRQHTVEERLAKWLLSTQDCLQSPTIPLTQEFIANMLGIRRSGVTVAARSLLEAGIIQYSRGKITIVDQYALEKTSCECYRLVQSEFMRLLGSRRG